MSSICFESLDNGLANTAGSSNNCDDDHDVCIEYQIVGDVGLE